MHQTKTIDCDFSVCLQTSLIVGGVDKIFEIAAENGRLNAFK